MRSLGSIDFVGLMAPNDIETRHASVRFTAPIIIAYSLIGAVFHPAFHSHASGFAPFF